MIKKCGWCHGKGKRHFIRRMTFGSEPEIDARWIECEQCHGEGKIYICPASKAPNDFESDDLAPARGCFNGLLLTAAAVTVIVCLVLWGFNQ